MKKASRPSGGLNTRCPGAALVIVRDRVTTMMHDHMFNVHAAPQREFL